MRGPTHDGALAIPWDWEGELPEEVRFWDGEKWAPVVPLGKRFWLPFVTESTYEEALAIYTLWVEEAKKAGDQLVLMALDSGCVRGRHEDPWIGIVHLTGFRGKFLDFLEPDKDVEWQWLKAASLWLADPKTRITFPSWPTEDLAL